MKKLNAENFLLLEELSLEQQEEVLEQLSLEQQERAKISLLALRWTEAPLAAEKNCLPSIWAEAPLAAELSAIPQSTKKFLACRLCCTPNSPFFFSP